MNIQCIFADPILDNPLVEGQIYTVHPVRDVLYNPHGCLYVIDGKIWDGSRFKIVNIPGNSAQETDTIGKI